MEPLSALGVAAAAVQFLDFTAKVVSSTYKVYQTDPGCDIGQNATIRAIAKDTQRLNSEVRQSLSRSNTQSLNAGEKEIISLGKACDEMGSRLLQALDSLQKQPKPRKHVVWDDFRIALRTVWGKDDIESLSKDLQNYRQQITMQLVVAQRYVTSNLQIILRADPRFHQRELLLSAKNDYTQAIDNATQAQVRAIDDNTDLCRKILNRVDGNSRNVLAVIRQNYSVGAPGIMNATSPTKLQEILQHKDTTHICQMVLHKLQYQEMHYRYEGIALAHQQTFEWLFRPPSKPAKWADFTQWLQQDMHSLYWITGKPGAGKSTLMRFVYDHDRTKELLKAWRPAQDLLTASFFFWNSGTEMQMSYEGLVRSLMFQILEQAPELISIAFPHRISDGVLFGDCIFGQQEWSWSWQELLRAFSTMLRNASTSRKLIVFIDGMDEFNGNPSELVDFVKELVMPGVKICASSRPWNQFQDAFKHGPHLRVEHLTWKDINRYVTHHLIQSAAFTDYEQSEPGFSVRLIKDVCDKSEGVFLWVHLVTRSLLEGLQDGERPNDLFKRLENLPTDIEELFQKILGSLSPWHSERCSQLFQIYRASLEPLTLLDMSFADEDDLDFAINAPIGEMSDQERNSRAELMTRRLNACTKGLLEAKTNEAIPEFTQVSLLHRTVGDWLDRDDIWPKICSLAPATFTCEFRLCNSHIMCLKSKDSLHTGIYVGFKSVTYATEYAVRGKNINAVMAEKLLSTLDKVYAQLTVTPIQIAITADNFRNYSITLLKVAYYCDLFAYLEQAFNSFSVGRRSQIASQFLYAATHLFSPLHLLSSLRHTAPNPRLMRFLLDQGADPNFMPPGYDFSVWDQILEHCHEIKEYDTSGVHTIIEDFLRFGATTQNARLGQYLETTRFDTAYIRSIIAQKEKEKPTDGTTRPIMKEALGRKKKHSIPFFASRKSNAERWSFFSSKIRAS
jgi:hypothetical protein